MNIHKATKSYEEWLGGFTPLIEADLALKHAQMTAGAFPFLRSTFYRWAQRWPKVCPEIAAAPEVLSVGDLHVENFGTWRDPEGRLIWGINDFDEACRQPYTVDLARLATSAHLAIEANHLCLECVHACEAILEGYREGLSQGGRPFVLAEDHDWLRKTALGDLRDPVEFWRKMDTLGDIAVSEIPETALAALENRLREIMTPGAAAPQYQLKRRTAGLGSLGHPRYVAVTDWQGGRIAREVKALVPSAAIWARDSSEVTEIFYQAIMKRAVRCQDPCVHLEGRWLLRRLAPDCIRVELAALPKEHEEQRLLRAMGYETANIHLGENNAAAILQDLDRRAPKWLHLAATAMGDDTMEDWRAWRES
ncbi:hypothetical protein CCAX7_001810 [Capsulimonas corticalis]|uniref:Uncharacterized protein n=1 Tax=Capsulimonas corticalis TaxID=2219043 RepID=A0A402CRQ8_9BACT|nr:DUF2252 family protein [Capsulimonas corticalis]BDI28130.1 hypothetical protein CCAX7_001810 [Capsulimonas corticalis]